jgi:glutathione S-transferase
MKLYMHPISTTSRAVMLFLEDNGIKVEQQVVDLFAGEHYKEPFVSINPSRLVPVLEDDGFRLTESSAILKYVAEKVGSPAYPEDLQKRARVNERMDWFNSNLSRDYGYGLVYPQVFPNHKRPSEAIQEATLAWHKERTGNWLQVLNDRILGPEQKYLCGDEITIADYFAAVMLSIGDAIGCQFSKYPNVANWLERMKRRPAWNAVNGPFEGWVASLKGQKFEAI